MLSNCGFFRPYRGQVVVSHCFVGEYICMSACYAQRDIKHIGVLKVYSDVDFETDVIFVF